MQSSRISFSYIVMKLWASLADKTPSILQVAFTRKKDFGKEARELKWAHAQRTLNGLQPPDTKMFNDRTNLDDPNRMAEDSKRRAEIAR